MGDTEITLSIDQFSRNKKYEGNFGRAITVTNLFAAKRGKLPCHPEEGFDIERYRFTDIMESIPKIKNDFIKHCEIWIPHIMIHEMNVIQRNETSLVIIIELYDNNMDEVDEVHLQINKTDKDGLLIELLKRI